MYCFIELWESPNSASSDSNYPFPFGETFAPNDIERFLGHRGIVSSFFSIDYMANTNCNAQLLSHFRQTRELSLVPTDHNKQTTQLIIMLVKGIDRINK